MGKKERARIKPPSVLARDRREILKRVPKLRKIKAPKRGR